MFRLTLGLFSCSLLLLALSEGASQTPPGVEPRVMYAFHSRQLSDMPKSVMNYRAAPVTDGKYVAFAHQETDRVEVYRVPFEGGTPTLVDTLPGSGNISELRIRDGTVYTTSGGGGRPGTVRVGAPGGGRTLYEGDHLVGPIRARDKLYVSLPGGQRSDRKGTPVRAGIYELSANGDLRLVVDYKVLEPIAGIEAGRFQGFDVSDDGKLIIHAFLYSENPKFFPTHGDYILTVAAAGGPATMIEFYPRNGPKAIGSFAISANGEKIFYTTNDTIFRASFSGRDAVPFAKGVNGPIRPSADGNFALLNPDIGLEGSGNKLIVRLGMGVGPDWGLISPNTITDMTPDGTKFALAFGRRGNQFQAGSMLFTKWPKASASIFTAWGFNPPYLAKLPGQPSALRAQVDPAAKILGVPWHLDRDGVPEGGVRGDLVDNGNAAFLDKVKGDNIYSGPFLYPGKDPSGSRDLRIGTIRERADSFQEGEVLVVGSFGFGVVPELKDDLTPLLPPKKDTTPPDPPIVKVDPPIVKVDPPVGPTGTPPVKPIWDDPIGQQCFDRWIAETERLLNTTDLGPDNVRKPFRINRYGILESKGVKSAYSPDNFREYNYNRYWYMWDNFIPRGPNGSWSDAYLNRAGVPNLREFVTDCFVKGGGRADGNGGVTVTPPPGRSPGCCQPTPAEVVLMTLQAPELQVVKGQEVQVPIWLILGKDVANINWTVEYDPKVAVPDKVVSRGNLLEGLLETNTADTGLVRLGVGQTKPIQSTGTLAVLTFKAVGEAGTKTPLFLSVSKINDLGGKSLIIQRIHGYIEIVDKSRLVPGDCDGDGQLTVLDAQCALKMSVRLLPERPNMDLDNDGQVTSRDAVIILQRIAKQVAQ